MSNVDENKENTNNDNNTTKKSHQNGSKLLLLMILFLIVIAIIVGIFLVQRYYTSTKECVECKGKGKITGTCKGRQECWLCLGKNTRVLCNEAGRNHEYEYKKKEIRACSKCDGYKWTSVYECSNCKYMTYYCNKCGELSGTGYIGSMAVCALCNNLGFFECEHNIATEHVAKLECKLCEGKGRIPLNMETCMHTIVKDEAQAATCTTPGKAEGSHCSTCNAITDEQEIIPATGHTVEEWTDDKDGKHSGVCSVCKEKITENHIEENDEAKEGMTQGSHCKVCNATIKESEKIQKPAPEPEKPTEEVQKPNEETQKPTEDKKPEEKPKHTEHTVEKWKDNGSGKHTGKCTECGETVTENHKEVTDEKVAATCTTPGKTEGTHCSECNAVIKKQETIAATLHKIDKWTDEGNGEHSGKCSKCKETITETHGEETDEAVKATCTEEGKTAGVHCDRCKAVIKAQEKVPATGHKVLTWTDKGNGKHSGECTACKETIEERHTEEVDEAKEETCTTEGKTKGSHCSVCKAVIKAQETIPATGHTIEKWENLNDSVHRGTCEDCGKTSDEKHEMTNGVCKQCKNECKHTNSRAERDIAKHWKKCNDCGLTVDEKEHSYTNGKCSCGKEQEIEECTHENLEWKHEEYAHWQECTECNERITETAGTHIYKDGACIKCEAQDPSTSDSLIPNTGMKQLIIMIISVLGLAVLGAVVMRKYKDI